MAEVAHYMPRRSGFVARVLARLGHHTVEAPPRVLHHVTLQRPRMYALESEGTTCVLVVGGRSKDMGRAANCLRSQGQSINFADSLAEVQSRVWVDGDDRPVKVSHLLVDVDALGGIATIYSELRRIRNTIPDLAVILMSADFSVDDFSLERLALCDASIRANFTFAGLEFAFSESVEVNNKVWQDRLADLGELPAAPQGPLANVVRLRPRLV